MKTISNCLWPSVFAAACLLLATKADGDEWGAPSNGLRMRMSLKSEQKRFTTNQPVTVLIQIQNVSTNDFIGIHIAPGRLEGTGLFSFVVMCPSGKSISLDTTERTIDGSARFLRPGDIMKFPYELTRLGHFGQIGTYRVIAKRTITKHDKRGKDISAELVSNPVYVTVVPEIESTDSAAKPAP